ncbi:MAG: hypothetical protein ACRCXD_14560 [Luteolibacter sp.]
MQLVQAVLTEANEASSVRVFRKPTHTDTFERLSLGAIVFSADVLTPTARVWFLLHQLRRTAPNRKKMFAASTQISVMLSMARTSAYRAFKEAIEKGWIKAHLGPGRDHYVIEDVADPFHQFEHPFRTVAGGQLWFMNGQVLHAFVKMFPKIELHGYGARVCEALLEIAATAWGLDVTPYYTSKLGRRLMDEKQRRRGERKARKNRRKSHEGDVLDLEPEAPSAEEVEEREKRLISEQREMDANARLTESGSYIIPMWRDTPVFDDLPTEDKEIVFQLQRAYCDSHLRETVERIRQGLPVEVQFFDVEKAAKEIVHARLITGERKLSAADENNPALKSVRKKIQVSQAARPAETASAPVLHLPGRGEKSMSRFRRLQGVAPTDEEILDLIGDDEEPVLKIEQTDSAEAVEESENLLSGDLVETQKIGLFPEADSEAKNFERADLFQIWNVKEDNPSPNGEVLDRIFSNEKNSRYREYPDRKLAEGVGEGEGETEEGEEREEESPENSFGRKRPKEGQGGFEIQGMRNPIPTEGETGQRDVSVPNPGVWDEAGSRADGEPPERAPRPPMLEIDADVDPDGFEADVLEFPAFERDPFPELAWQSEAEAALAAARALLPLPRLVTEAERGLEQPSAWLDFTTHVNPAWPDAIDPGFFGRPEDDENDNYDNEVGKKVFLRAWNRQTLEAEIASPLLTLCAMFPDEAAQNPKRPFLRVSTHFGIFLHPRFTPDRLTKEMEADPDVAMAALEFSGQIFLPGTRKTFSIDTLERMRDSSFFQKVIGRGYWHEFCLCVYGRLPSQSEELLGLVLRRWGVEITPKDREVLLKDPDNPSAFLQAHSLACTDPTCWPLLPRGLRTLLETGSVLDEKSRKKRDKALEKVTPKATESSVAKRIFDAEIKVREQHGACSKLRWHPKMSKVFPSIVAHYDSVEEALEALGVLFEQWPQIKSHAFPLVEPTFEALNRIAVRQAVAKAIERKQASEAKAEALASSSGRQASTSAIKVRSAYLAKAQGGVDGESKGLSPEVRQQLNRRKSCFFWQEGVAPWEMKNAAGHPVSEKDVRIGVFNIARTQLWKAYAERLVAKQGLSLDEANLRSHAVIEEVGIAFLDKFKGETLSRLFRQAQPSLFWTQEEEDILQAALGGAP